MRRRLVTFTLQQSLGTTLPVDRAWLPSFGCHRDGAHEWRRGLGATNARCLDVLHWAASMRQSHTHCLTAPGHIEKLAREYKAALESDEEVEAHLFRVGGLGWAGGRHERATQYGCGLVQ